MTSLKEDFNTNYRANVNLLIERLGWWNGEYRKYEDRLHRGGIYSLPIGGHEDMSLQESLKRFLSLIDGKDQGEFFRKEFDEVVNNVHPSVLIPFWMTGKPLILCVSPQISFLGKNPDVITNWLIQKSQDLSRYLGEDIISGGGNEEFEKDQVRIYNLCKELGEAFQKDNYLQNLFTELGLVEKKQTSAAVAAAAGDKGQKSPAYSACGV